MHAPCLTSIGPTFRSMTMYAPRKGGLMSSDLWEQSMLSAEGSPARTFPSQGSEPGWLAPEPGSFGTHSLSRNTSKQAGSSWKMCLESSAQIEELISGQSSLRWPTQGSLTSNGVLWIRNSPESPNAGVESSLLDVLQPVTDDRYLLSVKACAGIIRRASRRGRTLPPPLMEALQAVVSSQPSPETDWAGGVRTAT